MNKELKELRKAYNKIFTLIKKEHKKTNKDWLFIKALEEGRSLIINKIDNNK
tara:strand:+ start:678 stop:833 length:156 start_codon:yes stop_codon:yes gene_type:complete